ncbi:uncharacterized protein [Montipora capricornis]
MAELNQNVSIPLPSFLSAKCRNNADYPVGVNSFHCRALFGGDVVTVHKRFLVHVQPTSSDMTLSLDRVGRALYLSWT